jgi:hypothetical protein
MIDSGIYGRLEVEKIGRKNRLRKLAKKEQLYVEGVSSLGGGLVTLFILYGVLVLATFVTVSWECRHQIRSILKEISVRISIAWKRWRQKMAQKWRQKMAQKRRHKMAEKRRRGRRTRVHVLPNKP